MLLQSKKAVSVSTVKPANEIKHQNRKKLTVKRAATVQNHQYKSIHTTSADTIVVIPHSLIHKLTGRKLTFKLLTSLSPRELKTRHKPSVKQMKRLDSASLSLRGGHRPTKQSKEILAAL